MLEQSPCICKFGTGLFEIERYVKCEVPHFFTNLMLLCHKGNTSIMGKPSTFNTVEETQIPALQNHCHVLAAAARVKAAREFVTRLDRLLVSIIGYLSENGTVRMTKRDRDALRARWSTAAYYEQASQPKYVVAATKGSQFDEILDRVKTECPQSVTPNLHRQATLGLGEGLEVVGLQTLDQGRNVRRQHLMI